jgi:hypothetical protein
LATHPAPTPTRILTRELLCPVPELRLKREVPRPLNGRQKPGELLLLRLDEGDSLLLQADRGVEQSAYARLVRLRGRKLPPKLSPAAPLLSHDGAQLGPVASVDPLELLHLRIIQSQTFAGYLRCTITDLLLEHLAIRIPRVRLSGRESKGPD